jgi:phosphotransferase system HPr (HPr) family protein
MKEGIFIMGNKLGIHARPAAEILKMTSKYKCKVIFEANNRKADARSVLMLIALGAKKDCEIKLTVTDDEEELLFAELSDYISNNFFEE